MVTLQQTNGHIAYNLKYFVIDTEDDLQYLPIDVLPGSYALCISNSAVYMLNSKGE